MQYPLKIGTKWINRLKGGEATTKVDEAMRITDTVVRHEKVGNLLHRIGT